MEKTSFLLCLSVYSVGHFIQYRSEFCAHRLELFGDYPAFIQGHVKFIPDRKKFNKNHAAFNEDR